MIKSFDRIGTEALKDEKLLKVFKSSDLFNPGPSEIRIPYEYSIGGKFYLNFKILLCLLIV